MIALVTMIVGEDEYEEMEAYGAEKRGILPDISGIAERDTGGTFERIFRSVEPKELLRCMQGRLQGASKSGGGR